MGRNTQTLEEIINLLTGQLPDRNTALEQLEQHFSTRLLVDAGDAHTIEAYAKTLRLRVEKEELPLVLDYIASKEMCHITIDHVELAINELLGQDRFIEP
jgi:hypothetical protein